MADYYEGSAADCHIQEQAHQNFGDIGINNRKRALPEEMDAKNGADEDGGPAAKKKLLSRNLYVNNLNFECDEDVLFEFFYNILGDWVDHTEVFLQPDGSPTGTGLVAFKTFAACQKALNEIGARHGKVGKKIAFMDRDMCFREETERDVMKRRMLGHYSQYQANLMGSGGMRGGMGRAARGAAGALRGGGMRGAGLHGGGYSAGNGVAARGARGGMNRMLAMTSGGYEEEYGEYEEEEYLGGYAEDLDYGYGDMGGIGLARGIGGAKMMVNPAGRRGAGMQAMSGHGGALGSMGRPPTHNIDPIILEALNIDPSCMTQAVYCANLVYKMGDEESLKKLFSLAGEVLDVSLFKDKNSGDFQGKAVIAFESVIQAVQAISMYHDQYLYGRNLIVQMDKKFNPSKLQMHASSHLNVKLPAGLQSIGTGLGLKGLKKPPVVQPKEPEIDPQILQELGIEGPITNGIFISNLHFLKTTEENIREVLQLAGEVTKLELYKGKDGKFIGRCTAEFAEATEAVQAISMFDGQILNERQMVVRMDTRKSAAAAGQFELPDGMDAIGPGLGANGAPIRKGETPCVDFFIGGGYGSSYMGGAGMGMGMSGGMGTGIAGTRGSGRGTSRGASRGAGMGANTVSPARGRGMRGGIPAIRGRSGYPMANPASKTQGYQGLPY